MQERSMQEGSGTVDYSLVFRACCAAKYAMLVAWLLARLVHGSAAHGTEPFLWAVQGALRQMNVFLDAGFPRYEAARQFADARAVSRLSPYLHFGQLSANVLAAEARRRDSPRVLDWITYPGTRSNYSVLVTNVSLTRQAAWGEPARFPLRWRGNVPLPPSFARRALGRQVGLTACSPSRRRGGPAVSKTFSRRLAWRDLASWQLLHWPRMPAEPIRAPYAHQVGAFTVTGGFFCGTAW